jgi:hypothetical protein
MPDLLSSNPNIRTSYTQADLRSRVRSDISQADSVFISDTDLNRWGKEAQDIIARSAEWYQFIETISTSGGVRDYDLPVGCISLTKVQFDIWPLIPASLQELYAGDPLWRQVGASLPRYYIVGAGSRLTLYPTPAGASGLLLIYSALPPAPLGDLDTYYSPVGGEEALVYYCCLKASLKDGGTAGLRRADYFEKLWSNALGRITAESRDLAAEQVLVVGGARRRNGGITTLGNVWYRYPPVP